VLAGLGLVEITGFDAFDPIAALVVAGAIVFAGLRILTGSSRVLLDEAPPPEELDRIEATLERAHALAHRLRDAIEAEVLYSDVLIHVEPEGAVRDPASRDAAPYRAG
jgi:divalent metal cation (Fe/Co/Zn/Cd) transporter